MATETQKLAINTDDAIIESRICEVTIGELNIFVRPDSPNPLECYRTGKGPESVIIDDEGVWIHTPAGRQLKHRWSD